MKKRTKLPGLSLRWHCYKGGRPIPTLHGFWNEKHVPRQTSASLEKNTLEAAIEHCRAPRAAAGMPVPSMSAALRAIRVFLERGPKGSTS